MLGCLCSVDVAKYTIESQCEWKIGTQYNTRVIIRAEDCQQIAT